MRRILAAVAFWSVGLFGAAHAQPLQPADTAFYGDVAARAGNDAVTNQPIPWSADGRSGSVTFAAPLESGCRTFTLVEARPAPKPPVLGEVCPLRMGVTSGPPILVASNIRTAPAAGPGGEPGATTVTAPPPPPARTGATRGIGAPPPSPSTGSTGATRGLGSATPPPVSARLVPLGRSQDRIDRAGGHAVVLFRNVPAAATRNRVACEALVRRFETSTFAQTQVGVEKQKDGTVVRLRPIFWPIAQATGAPQSGPCTQRLTRYDYTRAAAILDKVQRPGAGPFLVVSRDDQRQAAIIDMTGLTEAQIDPMVVYFRDRFSQESDIWSAQANTVARREGHLFQIFGGAFSRNLLATISTFTANSALISSGCIGDARDATPCRR